LQYYHTHRNGGGYPTQRNTTMTQRDTTMFMIVAIVGHVLAVTVVLRLT
jgi:hypothetical protein